MNATAAVLQEDHLDSTSVGAIVAGAVAVVTAVVTGLWKWLGDRKRHEIDAQASLVSGFVSLLTSVQNERDRLLGRIGDLESNNQKQDRRISKLERVLSRNNIAIPDGHDADDDK
jgi:hypothetical protein